MNECVNKSSIRQDLNLIGLRCFLATESMLSCRTLLTVGHDVCLLVHYLAIWNIKNLPIYDQIIAQFLITHLPKISEID